jgi:threonine aldolase
LTIDLERVQTNIIFFDLAPDRPAPQEIVARLRERGVLMSYYPGEGFRAVTHYWIDDQGIEKALEALKEALAIPAH